MRLLFDEQLSNRLPRLLADCYPDSLHVEALDPESGDNDESQAVARGDGAGAAEYFGSGGAIRRDAERCAGCVAACGAERAGGGASAGDRAGEMPGLRFHVRCVEAVEAKPCPQCHGTWIYEPLIGTKTVAFARGTICSNAIQYWRNGSYSICCARHTFPANPHRLPLDSPAAHVADRQSVRYIDATKMMTRDARDGRLRTTTSEERRIGCRNCFVGPPGRAGLPAPAAIVGMAVISARRKGAHAAWPRPRLR